MGVAKKKKKKKCWENWTATNKRMKLDYCLITYTKLTQMDLLLEYKIKNHKTFWKKNTDGKLLDAGFGNDFFWI